MSKLAKPKKPTKPYPSFPLTAHNSGQWCKKIRGKVRFFGVCQDPQAALDTYLHQAADLHAGRSPTSQRTISEGGTTVKDVASYFLTYQIEKIESGEIDVRWFEDCRRVVENFSAFIGSGRLVSNLTPEDFQRFRHRLTLRGLGKKGRGLGVHALITTRPPWPYERIRDVRVERRTFGQRQFQIITVNMDGAQQFIAAMADRITVQAVIDVLKDKGNENELA